MGYVVLHLDKSTGNEAPMTAHIERAIMPPNADFKLTHLNKELMEFPGGVKNRTEAIQYRLENAGLKRKIGKNQVQVIRIMLTGSNEDMKRIEAEGKLDEWSLDNIYWLQKTFGKDNVVSAVLHLDEATPHIHASVVPIISGERRKSKNNPQNPEQSGKKQYKKKNVNAPRLCVDDVMTRDNLKEYQDTYAAAMNIYGLQRGIMGSEARHISTQQFYRDTIANKMNLQENINLLLEMEELKKQNIEIINRQEQETRMQYEQTNILQQQKTSELKETNEALQRVKGQLKTEKLKNAVAEIGSTIIGGVGSVVGTSKVKQQQLVIDSLNADKTSLIQEVKTLKQVIQSMQKEHESTIDKLKSELKKIYDLFHPIRELLWIEKRLRALRFPESPIRDILKLKPVGFKGKIYSPEYQQYFRTEHSVAKIIPHPNEAEKFQLTIDKVSDTNWFRQKYIEFQNSLGVNIKQESEQTPNRGIKR